MDMQLALALAAKYDALEDSQGKCCLEYVWIDGSKQKLRSKKRRVDKPPASVDEVQVWNFDGSSTGQASESNTDVYLKPVAIYKHPFMLTGENYLVLCETMLFDGTIIPSNTRASCAEVMEKAANKRPMFGIEQEYSFIDRKTGRPLGWHPDGSPPGPQGPYFCAAENAIPFGKLISDAHYKACVYAGLDICGTNAEVMPSQWEYQIGPSVGVRIGDHMWMSRFLLYAVADQFGVDVTFDPKLVDNYNGAGAHTNFSTVDTMDKKNGLAAINKAIEALSKRHAQHIAAYDPSGGADNARRLTGIHETADINVFTSGVAKRNVSIRIPAQVNKDGYGYLEDRRPASNCDPYAVCERLVRTVCLGE
uniref:glutamine synthetase n=1 Tax=Aceria tosichella TaxID=561515 RepID=A0A6G1SFL1_9ACAR